MLISIYMSNDDDVMEIIFNIKHFAEKKTSNLEEIDELFQYMSN